MARMVERTNRGHCRVAVLCVRPMVAKHAIQRRVILGRYERQLQEYNNGFVIVVVVCFLCWKIWNVRFRPHPMDPSLPEAGRTAPAPTNDGPNAKTISQSFDGTHPQNSTVPAESLCSSLLVSTY